MSTASPRVRLERISPADLAETAPLWRRLTAASDDPHYALTAEWLGAWAASVAPRPLALLHVGDDALGLVEQSWGGRWGFAGGPLSPHRRLLCARGTEDQAWRGLWRWLATDARSWSEFEAIGLCGGLPVPPRAFVAGQLSFASDLPGTFDDYLRARSAGSRKGLKGKLRRLEREGAEVAEVAPGGERAALRRFVELHGRRAAAKGERHPHVNESLVTLLAALPPDGEVALRLFELRVGGEVAGVTVRLDHHGTGYFYNAGIDPAHGRLSPGVVLELGSIRDAIERGLRHFHFGPGEYRYKRDLGGVPAPRYRVIAPGRSARGLVARVARAGYVRARAQLAGRRALGVPA